MTTELYVGNLPFSARAEDLQEAFGPFGVTEARVITSLKGRSKGYGFVHVQSEKSAEACSFVTKMDGRNLRVVPCENRAQHDESILENDLLEIFMAFDVNGDGVLTNDEVLAIARLNKPGAGKEDAAVALHKMDTNKDLEVDPLEFVDYFKGQMAKQPPKTHAAILRHLREGAKLVASFHPPTVDSGDRAGRLLDAYAALQERRAPRPSLVETLILALHRITSTTSAQDHTPYIVARAKAAITDATPSERVKLEDALEAVKLHEAKVEAEEEKRHQLEKSRVMHSLRPSVKQMLEDHYRGKEMDGFHLEKRGKGFERYEMERGQKIFSETFATEEELLETLAGEMMGESKKKKKKKKHRKH